MALPERALLPEIMPLAIEDSATTSDKGAMGDGVAADAVTAKEELDGPA